MRTFMVANLLIANAGNTRNSQLIDILAIKNRPTVCIVWLYYNACIAASCPTSYSQLYSTSVCNTAKLGAWSTGQFD